MSFLFYSKVATADIAEGSDIILNLQVSRAYTYLDLNFSFTTTFTESSLSVTSSTCPSMLTLLKNIELKYNGQQTIYDLSGAAATEVMSLNSPYGASVFRQTVVEASNVFTIKTFANIRLPFALPIFRGADMMKSILSCPSTSTLTLTIKIGKVADVYGLSSATSASVSGTLNVLGQYLSDYNAFTPTYLPVVQSQVKPVTVSANAQTNIYDMPSDGLLCAIASYVTMTKDYNLSSNLNKDENTGEARLYSASYTLMEADFQTARSIYYGSYGPSIPRLCSYAHYFFYSLVNGSLTNAWDLRKNNDARVEKKYDKIVEQTTKSGAVYQDENIQVTLVPR